MALRVDDCMVVRVGSHCYFIRFSASTIVDVTYAMWFNTFFSLLPTIALGTLDMDVSDRVAFKYPQLYGIGIRQELYGMERFWGVMAEVWRSPIHERTGSRD